MCSKRLWFLSRTNACASCLFYRTVINLNIEIGPWGIFPSPSKKDLIRTQYLVISNIAAYLASQVGVETVDCSFDLYISGLPAMKIIYSIVDLAD